MPLREANPLSQGLVVCIVCGRAGAVTDFTGGRIVIDRETVARIRHLHFAEHWRVGTIASELGLHHETVRGALQSVIRPLPPPRACRPARGNEKGRVERSIRFIRDSFFAARPFTTLTDFNRQALLWRSDVAAKRPWPQDDRMSVEDAFAEEVLRLMELPVHPFDADFMGTVRSAKTIYVRFDKNDYSIPHSLVGRPLTLLASDWEVRILDGSTQVARHRRSYGRHERIEDQAHVDALLLEKARALASTPSSLLISVVPEAETFLEEGFKRGESAALMTTRLRLLLDDYGGKDLRAAVQEALLKGTPRTASVAYILGQQKRQTHRQAAPVDLSRRPDLKDLYVKPHAPETYDALSHSHDDDDSERD